MDDAAHSNSAVSTTATALTHPAQAAAVQPDPSVATNPTTPIPKEKTSRLWRIVPPVAAVCAGIAVTTTRIWELFYDEIKKTDGFRQRRGTFLADRDKLAEAMFDEEKTGWSPWKRFQYYQKENHGLSKAYGRELLEKMHADLGIRSDGIWGRIVGTWQRYLIIGQNNKISAVIMGVLSGGATMTAAMLLHENHRLWNKLELMQNADVPSHGPRLDAEASSLNTEPLPTASPLPAASIQGPAILQKRLVAEDLRERTA